MPDPRKNGDAAALAEARQLPERARVAVVRRYRGIQGEQVVELRLERIDAAASPVVVLAQDVTEQARAEEELSHMREALFQSEHMSILGELASSVAHELGNRVRDRVRVSVADEGTGIAPEHLAHLFQPFFTTKGSAGTGLGLWLAQSTMRRIGGAISARNRRAGGAEFLVELQVAGNGHRVRPA